jgi:hypothetical protein
MLLRLDRAPLLLLFDGAQLTREIILLRSPATALENILLLFDGTQLMREIILLRSPATAPENILDAW